MNPSLKPDEFATLQRLLALKRHESPPPGFLNGFSGRVVARIQADQATPGRSWWRWLSDHLVARPVFAGAGGLAAGILVVGVLAPSPDPLPDSMDLARSALSISSPATVIVANHETGPSAVSHDAGLVSYGDVSSVTPVVDPPSPFSRRFSQSAAVRVNYTPLR